MASVGLLISFCHTLVPPHAISIYIYSTLNNTMTRTSTQGKKTIQEVLATSISIFADQGPTHRCQGGEGEEGQVQHQTPEG